MKNSPLGYRRRMPKRNNPYIGLVIVVGFVALVMQAYWMQKNWGTVRTESPMYDADPEFFKKLSARVIHLYECEYCQGNGMVTDSEQSELRVMCPICYGVGYHATRRFGDQERMCIACGGMGRLRSEDGDFNNCVRCGGRGIVFVDVELPDDPSLAPAY